MISSYVLSELANHLWQSTAVAALAGLLVLALRNNQAQIRYRLWMFASIKFLIPLSLIATGLSYLTPPVPPKVIAQRSVTEAFEQVTQPFSPRTSSIESKTFAADTLDIPTQDETREKNPWPAFLLGLWACGAVAVAFNWWRKWRGLKATVLAADQVSDIAGLPVLSSQGLLEPGVFGVLKPVLILPEGIERLPQEQLNAILAHEVTHFRRRDNLTAALHMIVETVFWFHPLVWWIGSRLVEEREQACDEAVLQCGNEAQVYAEGILNVCKLYFESPLPCVSGVTGSDLKKRIVRILSKPMTRKLDLTRKLLLTMAGAMAIALPVVFSLEHAVQLHAQAPAQNPTKDISGTWQGTLMLPDGKGLRTVVKIVKGDGNTWKSTFYSIDQGGAPLPVTKTEFQGTSVKFQIIRIGGDYDGKLSSDGNSITGNFTQGPKPLPLNFVKVTPDTAWAIPEPTPPPKPMAANANPTFEVATIKPAKPGMPGRGFGVQGRHFSTMNTTVNSLLGFAYGLHPKQIVGGPAWMDSDKFDISAQPDGEGQPNDKQWKAMLAKLLEERFQLKFHHDKKELSVYSLVVAKSGPKITKSQGDPDGLPGMFFRGLGNLPVSNATMSDFAGVMQGAVLDRPVVDQTGLTGRWDFILKWTPDETQFTSMGIKIEPPADPANAPPGLFTAIQEELGLKFDSAKLPVDVIVIDKLEKPTEN